MNSIHNLKWKKKMKVFLEKEEAFKDLWYHVYIMDGDNYVLTDWFRRLEDAEELYRNISNDPKKYSEKTKEILHSQEINVPL